MRPTIGSKLVMVLVVGLASVGLIPGSNSAPSPDRWRSSQDEVSCVAEAEPEDLVLLAKLRCVACHEATWNAESVYPKLSGPSLVGIGSRAPQSWLERWLLSPQGVKPGTHMPEVLGAMPKVFRSQIAKRLAAYLASFGTPPRAKSTGVSAAEVRRGRNLYHRVGCVACHAPEASFEALDTPEAEARTELNAAQRLKKIEELRVIEQDPELFVLPGTYEPLRRPLTHLSAKSSITGLMAFLQNPLKHRPSGLMPSLGLSAEEARAIACYLLRDQREAGGGEAPGLRYELFSLSTNDGVAVFDGQELLADGSVAKVELPKVHPKDQFSLRLTGFIAIDSKTTDVTSATEEIRFFLKSDDGSRLLIDGELVIANDGVHAPKERSATLRLRPGRHRIEVQFYEYRGGEELSLEWERTGPSIHKKRASIPRQVFTHEGWSFRSPGVKPEAEPLSADEAMVGEGRHWFQVLRCDSCHKAPEARDESFSKLPGKNEPPKLEDLKLRLGAGTVRHCIQPQGVSSEASQKQVTPIYDLSDDQRTQLVGLLQTVSTQATEPASAQADLLLYGCYSCHRRNSIGGVHPGRQEYFVLDQELDVGDEGRLPPHLSNVGWKLRRPWLEGVLLGTHRAHPHMATRMPYFGLRVARTVMKSVLAEDTTAESVEPRAYRDSDVAAGQQLAGIEDGLGCVRCHGLAEMEALGVPAVKLDLMWERLNYGWFKNLLLDPNSVNMGTRMPAFFDEGKSPVKSVYAGAAKDQVDALWHWLASGSDAPIPPGLERKGGAYQVIPKGRPSVVGVFMNQVSPRVLAIGHEDRVHAAYDVANARFAALWKGDFLDARGTWEGRAGKLLKLNPRDSLRLPKGPTVQQLPDPTTPWNRENTPRPKFVRRRDDKAGFPQLTAQMSEDIRWTETVRPQRSESGLGMRRNLTVRRLAPNDFEGRKLWWRVATGLITQDSAESRTYWLARREAKEAPCRIEVGPGSIALLRPGRGETSELLLQVQEREGADPREATVIYWW